MADNSNKSADAGGYSKIYKHQWHTHVNALPMSAKTLMEKVCEKKFGWHFIPHKTMKWERPDWYKDQTLVLSFESKTDLITSKLNITL